jgi:methionyl-tRNA formyltransferase
MKLVLMGTGPFAVPSFDALAVRGETILAVVVRPSVQSHQGKSPPESPVRRWAEQRGLPIVSPSSINDPAATQWLRSLQADLMVVCDYGQILSRDALAAVRLGGINLHGSLLPRHRGAAPVQWSILAGDTNAGVSVIHMTPALDSGPVIESISTPIGHEEDAGHLESRLSQLGAAATLRSVDSLRDESEQSIHQQSERATRAPRLVKQDGELHFGYSAESIDRQIRGLQPWPGAFGNLSLPDGKQVRLIVCKAHPIAIEPPQNGDNPHEIGSLLYGDRLKKIAGSYPHFQLGPLCVQTGQGLLALDIVQPSGKKPMTSEEFLRGYARHAWMRFLVPEAKHPLLERMIAMQTASIESRTM